MDTDSNSDSNESPSQTVALTDKKVEPSPADCVEPTMPHGACRDKSSDGYNKGSILHPSEDENTDDKVWKSCTWINLLVLIFDIFVDWPETWKFLLSYLL